MRDHNWTNAQLHYLDVDGVDLIHEDMPTFYQQHLIREEQLAYKQFVNNHRIGTLLSFRLFDLAIEKKLAPFIGWVFSLIWNVNETTCIPEDWWLLTELSFD